MNADYGKVIKFPDTPTQQVLGFAVPLQFVFTKNFSWPGLSEFYSSPFNNEMHWQILFQSTRVSRLQKCNFLNFFHALTSAYIVNYI